MRACIVREMAAKEFCERMMPAIGLVNLVVLASGTDASAEVVERISGLEQCTVLAAMEREDAEGEERGYLVADCGTVVGYAASVHALDGARTGARLRTWDVSAGKLGVLVGDDVMYPEAARFLRKVGAGYLVVLGHRATPASIVMARAHAVANGIRTVACFPDCGFIADFDGKANLFNGRVVTLSCENKTDDRMLRGLRPAVYNDFGQ